MAPKSSSRLWPIMLCILLAYHSFFVDAVPPRPGVVNSPKGKPKKPVADLPELDDVSLYVLGEFTWNPENQQRLFESFTDQSLPYFSKLYDFFLSQSPEYIVSDAYSGATEPYQPFPNGLRPTRAQKLRLPATQTSPATIHFTTTFDPGNTADVCRAWTSLWRYCGGPHTDCICFSATYYVPDQWNMLAAGCAPATRECQGGGDKDWCRVGKLAVENARGCAMQGHRPFKFAEIADGAAEPEEETVEEPKPTPAAAQPATKDSPAPTPQLTAAAPAPSETGTQKPSPASTTVQSSATSSTTPSTISTAAAPTTVASTRTSTSAASRSAMAMVASLCMFTSILLSILV